METAFLETGLTVLAGYMPSRLKPSFNFRWGEPGVVEIQGGSMRGKQGALGTTQESLEELVILRAAVRIVEGEYSRFRYLEKLRLLKGITGARAGLEFENYKDR